MEEKVGEKKLERESGRKKERKEQV